MAASSLFEMLTFSFSGELPLEQVSERDQLMWGGDRFCMRGSLPRKRGEALRDKALGRASRICTAGRKMRFYYDLCDEFCTITDC